MINLGLYDVVEPLVDVVECVAGLVDVAGPLVVVVEAFNLARSAKIRGENSSWYRSAAKNLTSMFV